MQFEEENSVNLSISNESLWNYISKWMYLEPITASLPHYIYIYNYATQDEQMVFASFLSCVFHFWCDEFLNYILKWVFSIMSHSKIK